MNHDVQTGMTITLFVFIGAVVVWGFFYLLLNEWLENRLDERFEEHEKQMHKSASGEPG
jgi:hypothetical protein